MADEEDIAALVIDNGSGMCKGKFQRCGVLSTLRLRRRDDVKAVRGIVFVGARDTGTSWALLGINSLGTIWFCCVDAGEMGIASTAAVNLCIHIASAPWLAFCRGRATRSGERSTTTPLVHGRLSGKIGTR